MQHPFSLLTNWFRTSSFGILKKIHRDYNKYFYSLCLVGQGVTQVGNSMLFVSIFWPGMVLKQGQLSIVVSDWESYLGSLFSFRNLLIVVFCLVFCTWQDCFGFPSWFILFECFFDPIKSWTLTTLHFGPILHATTTVTPPLRPVRSRWLALASYSSPNPLAPGHLQVSAR